MEPDTARRRSDAPVDPEGVKDTIHRILADLLETDASEIRAESNLEKDLGADSLLFLELFESLRTEFKIHLDLHQIAKYARTQRVTTVGDLCSVVTSYLEKGDALLKEFESR